MKINENKIQQDKILEIIKKCTKLDTSERPTALEVCEMIQKLNF